MVAVEWALRFPGDFNKIRRDLLWIVNPFGHHFELASSRVHACPKGCGDLIIGHNIGETCLNGAKNESQTINFEHDRGLAFCLLVQFLISFWMEADGWSDLVDCWHTCGPCFAATWVGSMPDIPKEQWQQEKLPVQWEQHAASQQLPAPRLTLAESYP